MTISDTSPLVTQLLEIVRVRDPELAAHGQRAAHVAAAIAMEMGLDTGDVDRAYLAGLLHDVGKLGVAEAILWKPAGLDRSEWAQIRTHPEKGHRLVSEIVHRDVAAAVLSHHERRDGCGYPHGLDGRTLPTIVHIVQVADAFDAITSARPYQGAIPAQDAVDEIIRCSGTQFEPAAAAALATLLEVAFDSTTTLDLATRSALTETPADPFAATA
jgi:HD-GYP domain-containing protein (c-di-GMP phosphodiesterase class II)